jgi:hypothetical protein
MARRSIHSGTAPGKLWEGHDMRWIEQTRGISPRSYTVWVLEFGDGTRLVTNERGTVAGSDGTGGWRHIAMLRAAGLVTATYHGPDTFGHTTYHAVIGGAS